MSFLPRTGIQPLFRPKEFDAMNWAHRHMMWPRSLTEWHTFLHSLHRDFIFNHTKKEDGISYLWYRKEAVHLEAFFEQNQRIRFQMRRIVSAFLRRKMERRILGEMDVGTMEKIPERALVCVYDIPSRSIYKFHVQTIHRHIVGSLRYQSLAISSPKYPKNPYTNLPWSIGQLLVLFDQMHRFLWLNGCIFLDPAAQAFYRSGLCLKRFQVLFGEELDKDCSRRFFHDPTSEYWEVIYSETLTELFHLLHVQQPLLRTLLLDQSLPKPIMDMWNDFIWAFWCYENLGRMVLPDISSIYDLQCSGLELLKTTIDYVKKKRLRKRVE